VTAGIAHIVVHSHLRAAVSAEGPLRDLTNRGTAGNQAAGQQHTNSYHPGKQHPSGFENGGVHSEPQKGKFDSNEVGIVNSTGSHSFPSHSGFESSDAFSSVGGASFTEGSLPVPDASLRAAAPNVSLAEVDCARTESTTDAQWRRNYPWSQVIPSCVLALPLCTCQGVNTTPSCVKLASFGGSKRNVSPHRPSNCMYLCVMLVAQEPRQQQRDSHIVTVGVVSLESGVQYELRQVEGTRKACN
jgi:hypothetical protein